LASEPTERLEAITADVLDHLSRVSQARETALGASRSVVRRSANAIRALHRGDHSTAAELLDEAAGLLEAAVSAVAAHPHIRWAGFVHDAQKEYAEARLTEAVLGGLELPDPAGLDVTPEAWLHGVAEAIGELRRSVLDRLRTGDVDAAESLFSVMDEMYGVLVRIDYPDAMTSGLRRATDADRAILERTRADLAVAVVQTRLEKALRSKV
jgi:translin